MKIRIMALRFLYWLMNKYPNILLFISVFAILALGFIPNAARAQELQFSKVLLLDAREDRPVAWTVPEGKAWKIVSAGSECAGGSLYVFFDSKLAFFLFISIIIVIQGAIPYSITLNHR